ncbi:hypothetical protein LXL04_000153 [Taraxacum kok-saghyz]
MEERFIGMHLRFSVLKSDCLELKCERRLCQILCVTCSLLWTSSIIPSLPRKQGIMEVKPSNGNILEELRNGAAEFELVSSPVTSISTNFYRNAIRSVFITDHTHTHPFFARIGQKMEVSPPLSKVESLKVHKVNDNGRCMFRALVKGMAMNKSVNLTPREERESADDLRMAIKKVLCDNHKERHKYEDAIVAITVKEYLNLTVEKSLKRYCQRIGGSDFLGGESELLVLSKLYKQPIVVYISEHEHTRGRHGYGYIPIAEYGGDFGKGSMKEKGKKAVRLLYNGTNHYDLLAKPSNGNILEELRNGVAEFELVSSPVTSISTNVYRNAVRSVFITDHTHAHRFFARIGTKMEVSPALSKVESFRVHKVTGDGRCMFRALVKGMAMNKSVTLNPREERESADELRMAIKEVLCDNHKERHKYEEAIIAITVEESLKRYCQRIGRSDFWGGESELLVLSKLCRQPIVVYIPEHEHTRGGHGYGYIPIAEYGGDFGKGKEKGKKAVRLLYSGRNHYDLLV